MRAPSAPADESARIDALDGVRGLAILLVVLLHGTFYGVPLPGVAPLPEHPYWRLAGLGWCGVDVFFVLSGFLITGILLRSKGAPGYFRNFYARRALRIFPLYYLVLALLLWVLPRPPATPAEQVSYLLYYQNLRLAFAVDAHFDPAREITWSLAIEEQFYLVWPAVVWLVSRRGLVRVCVAAIAGAIALRFWMTGVPDVRTHVLTPCRVDTLAAGALLAVVGLPPRWLAVTALAAGALGLVVLASWTGTSLPEHPTDPRMQRYALLAALAFAVGVVALAAGGGRLAGWLRLAPLRSLGRYSYCIYLVHFVVVDELAHAAFRDLDPGLQDRLAGLAPPTVLLVAFTLVCLVGSWAIAVVSWHLYEKWFLALKRFFPSGGGARVR